MVEAARFIDGQFDHFLGTGCQANFAENDAVSTTDDMLYRLTNFVQIDAEAQENLPGNTFTLAHEAKQQMFSSDVVVLKALGFFLRQAQHFPGAFCEFVKSVSIMHPSVVPPFAAAHSWKKPAQQSANEAA